MYMSFLERVPGTVQVCERGDGVIRSISRGRVNSHTQVSFSVQSLLERYAPLVCRIHKLPTYIVQEVPEFPLILYWTRTALVHSSSV